MFGQKNFKKTLKASISMEELTKKVVDRVMKLITDYHDRIESKD